MEHIQKTIDTANEKIRQLEAEIISHKKLVNQLCAFAKLEPQYADDALQPEGAPQLTVRRNSFFGQPLRTLRARVSGYARQGKAWGPRRLMTFLRALKTGGYDLEQISTKSDTDQKRGLAIMLGKNSQTFIRLPNDDWGLVEWYPGYKDKRRKKTENGNGKEDSAAPAGGETEELTELEKQLLQKEEATPPE